MENVSPPRVFKFFLGSFCESNIQLYMEHLKEYMFYRSSGNQKVELVLVVLLIEA